MRIKSKRIKSFKEIKIGQYLYITNLLTNFEYLVKVSEYAPYDASFYATGLSSSYPTELRIYTLRIRNNSIKHYFIYEVQHPFLNKFMQKFNLGFLKKLINN